MNVNTPSQRGGRQTVKKPLGGVGGAAAPLTFIRVRRLRGPLILLAKSIPYNFGRPLVGRNCFLAKVVKTTFATRRRLPKGEGVFAVQRRGRQ